METGKEREEQQEDATPVPAPENAAADELNQPASTRLSPRPLRGLRIQTPARLPGRNPVNPHPVQRFEEKFQPPPSPLPPAPPAPRETAAGDLPAAEPPPPPAPPAPANIFLEATAAPSLPPAARVPEARAGETVPFNPSAGRNPQAEIDDLRFPDSARASAAAVPLRRPGEPYRRPPPPPPPPSRPGPFRHQKSGIPNPKSPAFLPLRLPSTLPARPAGGKLRRGLIAGAAALSFLAFAVYAFTHFKRYARDSSLGPLLVELGADFREVRLERDGDGRPFMTGAVYADLRLERLREEVRRRVGAEEAARIVAGVKVLSSAPPTPDIPAPARPGPAPGRRPGGGPPGGRGR